MGHVSLDVIEEGVVRAAGDVADLPFRCEVSLSPDASQGPGC